MIPLNPSLEAELSAFVHAHCPPGPFIAAALAGDLFGAIENAEPGDLEQLPAVTTWLYCNAPWTSYGSVDAVAEWLAQNDLLVAVWRERQAA